MRALLGKLVLAALILAVVGIVAIQLDGGTFALAAAVLLARFWRWPAVRIRYYFTTARIVLPATAFAAGVTAQFSFDRLHEPLTAIGWVAASAACLSILILIFEEKLWKTIFQRSVDATFLSTLEDRDRYHAVQAGTNFAAMHGSDALKARLIEAGSEWRSGGKNGVLMFGPPGTGKTAFARALAGELGLPIITATFGDLASKWVNESTERIVAMFDAAKAQAPCVLFIDEADAVLKDRANSGGDPAEYERMVATFLDRAVRLRESRVLLMAATNFIDRLDPAAIREGRFDFHIEVPLPDDTARRNLIGERLQRVGCTASDATLARLSKRWAGFNVPRLIAATAAAGAIGKQAGRTTLGYPDFYAGLRRVQGRKGGAPEGAKDLSDLFMEPAQAERLREIASQLSDVDALEQIGASIPRGLLFYGPPGTGKTATAMALARGCGWSFIERSGRELLEDGAIARLRKDASDLRPAIVFLDEADDILADRQLSNYKLVTNELLTLVDGAGGMLPDVVWIAATNHASSIDEAALRAGRFEQKMPFGPPSTPVALRMVEAWAADHATYLADVPARWAERVLPYLHGLTAANVFGVLRNANNIAAARSRAGRESREITPAHVAEAVNELTGTCVAAAHP